MSKRPLTVALIPDTQVKPGVETDHLLWAGRYLLDKQIPCWVHIGDHADMPSLSSYDSRSGKSFEGRRYKDDIDASNAGWALLNKPLDEYTRRSKGKAKFKPRRLITLGNHEERIVRAINNDPHTLEGVISLDDLDYARSGWEVHPFLDVVNIEGVRFSHYFSNPMTGRPWGGTAHTKLRNIGFSFVMGHQQGLDMASRHLSDGTTHWGLVAGSFYQHDEDYKGTQGNHHFRGIVVLHEVHDGRFDPMVVSLDFLRRRYS